ncbi:SDR family oxidoreductase [Sphingomonas oligophenolica]|uniref:SDR family NAD(P)-dependent oxidoreductase n=1 Tax=Sphingomonas oligophenolica TaxID=301154 RepID=A0ABU9YBG6_9SPHN
MTENALRHDDLTKSSTKSDLTGRTAIITGGGAGIGQAIALTLASHGARAIIFDRISDRVAETIKMMEAGGGTASGASLDITDDSAVDDAVSKIIDQGSGIDILVNCAGIFDDYKAAGGASTALWNRVIAVNLTAPFILTRAILPHMVNARRGSIINIASVAGLRGGVGGAAYTASKHGLIGLTRSVAWGYRSEGIRCNAICPGAIGGTAILDDSAIDMDYFALCEPVGALAGNPGEPQSIADAALFLASDQSSFMSGVVVPVDGGWSAG